jgi:hypothetical protein
VSAQDASTAPAALLVLVELDVLDDLLLDLCVPRTPSAA